VTVYGVTVYGVRCNGVWVLGTKAFYILNLEKDPFIKSVLIPSLIEHIILVIPYEVSVNIEGRISYRITCSEEEDYNLKVRDAKYDLPSEGIIPGPGYPVALRVK